MKLIAERVSNGDGQARERYPGPPDEFPIGRKRTVKKSAENCVFGRVRSFAHEDMKKIEGFPGNVNVEKAKNFVQQPL